MSQSRILAIAFLVVGVILAAVSVLADQVGLGAAGSSFGWKQLLGLVLGIVLVIGGILLLRQGDDDYEDDDYEEELIDEVDSNTVIDSEHRQEVVEDPTAKATTDLKAQEQKILLDDEIGNRPA